jgi:hypothetical protein
MNPWTSIEPRLRAVGMLGCLGQWNSRQTAVCKCIILFRAFLSDTLLGTVRCSRACHFTDGIMMTIPRTRLLIDATHLSPLIITVTSLLFAFSWLYVILYLNGHMIHGVSMLSGIRLPEI